MLEWICYQGIFYPVHGEKFDPDTAYVASMSASLGFLYGIRMTWFSLYGNDAGTLTYT